MGPMRAPVFALLMALAAAAVAPAQVPQPFPRPGSKPAQPPPAVATTAAPTAPAVQAAPALDPEHPTAEQLGIFIPETARFLASYDAGRGQRYFIFGTPQRFADVVAAYRASLKDKGIAVFEQPPTHTWEIGKFKEESMGFPPGVTVKDYTAGGSAGYPNPRRGEQPERFATLIQIVPPPPAAPSRR